MSWFKRKNEEEPSEIMKYAKNPELFKDMVMYISELAIEKSIYYIDKRTKKMKNIRNIRRK
jgi:hypothetical protein